MAIGRGRPLRSFGRNTRCPIGEARSTPAFGSLLDRGATGHHVIHAVAPDGLFGESEEMQRDLRAAYTSVLAEAARLEVSSLVLPAIGCGVNGWAFATAEQVALEAVVLASSAPSSALLRRVDVVLQQEEAWPPFRDAAEAVLGPPRSIFSPRESGDGCAIVEWTLDGPVLAARPRL